MTTNGCVETHAVSSKNFVNLALLALCFAAPMAAQTFTSFDVPHAGTLVSQGTIPVKINASGVIAGYYIDSGWYSHGFVRTAAGAITEFDVTGLTNPTITAINRGGQIVGYGGHVTSKGNTVHGFLRFANGQFVQINPPGAIATFPESIDDVGAIGGWYADFTGYHGFVRDAQGNYTVVDDPEAVSGRDGAGTLITAIHNSGTVAGNYDDVAGVVHGFVLNQFGTFSNFDAQGAGTCSGCGTFPLSIDEIGEVTGYYRDNSFTAHGFVRDNLGNITEFSMPDALETIALATNNFGKTVGDWTTSQNVGRGFFRDSSGALSGFSAPVHNFGTEPNDINDAGQITGFYVGDDQADHGFLQ